MPPEPIHDVLNAVLRIFGNYDGKYYLLFIYYFFKKFILKSLLEFNEKIFELKRNYRKYFRF